MKRRAMIFFAVVLLAVSASFSAGCGGADDRTDGSGKDPAATGSEGSNKVASGTLKRIEDFPNDQDGANVQAVIKTGKGDITVEFFPDAAPVTVASFLNLARSGFYNGLRFHRVVPNFVIQAGCPNSVDANSTTAGTGGPGYSVPAEFNDLPHQDGTLAMARANDINSGGSQFYICLGAQPNLDGQYTVFGRTVAGLDVVWSIAQGDLINEIVVQPKPGN